MRGDYPAGPYGTGENAILENLSFVSTEGEAFELESLYQDSSNQLLLLTTAADWCSVCIEEQPKLQSIFEEYQEDGLEIVVALFETSDYQPASAATAANWKTRFDLSYTVVADPEFQLDAYYDSALTPMNMVVDLASMQILWIGTGWDETTLIGILQARL